jgi:hypothetical protein
MPAGGDAAGIRSAARRRPSLPHRNFPGHPPGLEAGLRQLNDWVRDVRAGQRMTFIRIPGTGMQVDIDGTVKGMIAGDEFSQAFLSIWFGDHPQTPQLKRGLLGGPCK